MCEGFYFSMMCDLLGSELLQQLTGKSASHHALQSVKSGSC